MTIAPLAPFSRRHPAPWTPGPGYAELLTPMAWARPLGADECEVVIVRGTDDTGDGAALLSGVLSETLVSLADYWLDNPTELRLLVDTGLLHYRPISSEHPALARTTPGEEAGSLLSPSRLSAPH